MESHARNENEKLFALKFVSNLIEKGSTISCDETNYGFNSNRRLPTYYDREKFKRGQRFFHKHIWAMFFAKIMGLVTLLSVPDIARILKFTQKSGEAEVAYKRYLATLLHMYIWYNEDFRPESRIWKSMQKVKFKHNRASRQNYEANKMFISQKSMALTQFGFMGFAVWRTKLVGIYAAEESELEAFIHVWRVIGNIMGIDDRFNICRDSVKETKAICRELVRRVFQPEMSKKHEDFLVLSHALLTGMWCMMPLFQHKSFIHIIANALPSIAGNNNDATDAVDFNLNWFQRLYARMILGFMSLFRFNAIRIFHQYVIYISLWLMEHFPFLAYYSFGKANSHIQVIS